MDKAAMANLFVIKFEFQSFYQGFSVLQHEFEALYLILKLAVGAKEQPFLVVQLVDFQQMMIMIFDQILIFLKHLVSLLLQHDYIPFRNMIEIPQSTNLGCFNVGIWRYGCPELLQLLCSLPQQVFCVLPIPDFSFYILQQSVGFGGQINDIISEGNSFFKGLILAGPFLSLSIA